MKCTSCGFPYAPHELAGGLCLACLAKKASDLREAADYIANHSVCNCWELALAIEAIPADLSIKLPINP